MNNYQIEFLQQNALPDSYLTMAKRSFSPLINKIITLVNASQNKTIFIGLNGCQGSGKTTLGAYLVAQFKHNYHLNSVSCSLDDFYLSQQQRQQLATSVHPLLKTRGVPGTHDTLLIKQTLQNFANRKTAWQLAKFDKATDNPLPKAQWQTIESPVDVVIFEGWCWGTTAQSQIELITPINTLEKNEDPHGVWRNFVNEQIKQHYQKLYQKMHLQVMLKAPSFEQVFQWRLEQEQKLQQKHSFPNDKNSALMDNNELAHFILHFQRLTEHTLKTLPKQVDFLFELDKNRQIITPQL